MAHVIQPLTTRDPIHLLLPIYQKNIYIHLGNMILQSLYPKVSALPKISHMVSLNALIRYFLLPSMGYIKQVYFIERVINHLLVINCH